MIDMTKRLADALTLVVAGARTPARNTTAIAFRRWHVSRIRVAIDFRRAEERQASLVPRCQLQHVARSVDRYIERFKRIGAVIKWTGDPGGVNDIVDVTLLQLEGFANIALHKLEVCPIFYSGAGFARGE